ncbi:hypothetical protein [Lysinibacillus sp. NPDC092081]|uniref:hypothetical protein n=1 Tax=Lysinibacillus sp. NPDC092081 TaxID=3364131 RepID=UPI0037FBC4B8
MNKYANRITNIIITLFLVFVASLLTILIVYIINVSFKDQDTILAGCIGFIGAIIGGSITLIGVNKTIENNNLSKKLSDAPIKLEKIAYNIRFLMELVKNFEFIGMDNFQKPDVTYNKAKKLISDSNFIELSAGISPELYIKTRELEYLLMELNLKFNQQIEPYNHPKYYKDCQETILYLIKYYEKEENKLIEIIRENC